MKVSRPEFSLRLLIFRLVGVAVLMASTNLVGGAGIGRTPAFTGNASQIFQLGLFYLVLGVTTLPFVLISTALLLVFLHFANRRAITPRECVALYNEVIIPVSIPFFIHLLFLQLAGSGRVPSIIPEAVSFLAPAVSSVWLFMKYQAVSEKGPLLRRRSVVALALPVTGIGFAGLVFPILQLAFGVLIALKLLKG